ncbi:unnamed protein product, partial [Closterium sp. NIES-54]
RAKSHPRNACHLIVALQRSQPLRWRIRRRIWRWLRWRVGWAWGSGRRRLVLLLPELNGHLLGDRRAD